MKYQALALLTTASLAAAQGVTDKIAPTATAPEGCAPSVDGKFEIAIIPKSDKAKRDQFLQRRSATCSGDGILVAELNDGVIKDAQDRTGYIASNFQFQFDGPPQAGALYTAGFSYCPSNGSLALGGNTVWYQCKSGNFYNLYDRWWAGQCSPVDIVVMKCGGADTAANHGGVVVGTSVVVTTVVIPLGDGQPQVITTSEAIPMCQIGDGQVQGHTTPCASVPAPVPTVAPVSQFSDGQIQVTPVAPGPPPGSVVVTGTPAVSAPPAGGSGAPPGSVVVPGTPAVSVPPASGVPQNATTSRATGSLSSPVIANPSGPPTAAPPAGSSAGRIQVGSAAAFVVGLIGVFWFL